MFITKYIQSYSECQPLDIVTDLLIIKSTVCLEFAKLQKIDRNYHHLPANFAIRQKIVIFAN